MARGVFAARAEWQVPHQRTADREVALRFTRLTEKLLLLLPAKKFYPLQVSFFGKFFA
jgi:hypothetical protein